MKKSLLFAMILMIAVSIGYAPPTISAAETVVSVQKNLEIMPVRNDPEQPKCSIAMQAVWDSKRATWRRQIIPFNGATADMVTEEMKKLAEQLIPDRIGTGGWESWKFTIIYPAEGGREKTVAKSETVTVPTKSTAVPLPKIAVAATVEKSTEVEAVTAPATESDIKAELDALKAKLTAAESAEKKRLEAKSVAAIKPTARPTKKVAKVASAKPSTEKQLREDLKKYREEKTTLQKYLDGCAQSYGALAKERDGLKNQFARWSGDLKKLKATTALQETNLNILRHDRDRFYLRSSIVSTILLIFLSLTVLLAVRVWLVKKK